MTDLIARLQNAVNNCETDAETAAFLDKLVAGAGVEADVQADETETVAAFDGLQDLYLCNDGDSDCHTHGHTVVTYWSDGNFTERQADTDEVPPSHALGNCGYAVWSKHWTCDNCITRQHSVKSLSEKHQLGKYTVCAKCRRQYASNPARALAQFLENANAPASAWNSHAIDMCLD